MARPHRRIANPQADERLGGVEAAQIGELLLGRAAIRVEPLEFVAERCCGSRCQPSRSRTGWMNSASVSASLGADMRPSASHRSATFAPNASASILLNAR